ncbi:MAG: hypothetical protein NC122_09465 [Faecalibacterium sp.]|nr:hypothetical protein [Ruminococcus sp.]MCM1392422.1 hypothetical protein [Ruminococcus sp.]MCM1486419.1 hypothetical protein [Faecalibacterium sp.]
MSEKVQRTDVETNENGLTAKSTIPEELTAVTGMFASNAQLPQDVDLCIIKSIDVSDGVIKAKGTNIKYSEFLVEIPNLS